jgi:hypothetical protein
MILFATAITGGRPRIQPGAQHRLPRQVEVTAVLENRSGHELTHRARLVEAVALDQAVQGRGEHLLVGGGGVGAVGAGERNAHTADDGDAAGRRGLQGIAHLGLLLTSCLVPP